MDFKIVQARFNQQYQDKAWLRHSIIDLMEEKMSHDDESKTYADC